MSRAKNNSVRCDICGKLSRTDDGRYRRPNGEPGWINSQGGYGEADICEECLLNVVASEGLRQKYGIPAAFDAGQLE